MIGKSGKKGNKDNFIYEKKNKKNLETGNPKALMRQSSGLEKNVPALATPVGS